jgi:uncharacterized membrane protein YeiH
MFDWFKSIEFITVIDFIGTFAFAISGIRLASAKKFDWFGAIVVGMVTAVGGGTLRDVMLGTTPFWMQNGFYLVVTIFSLFFVLIFSKYLVHLNNTIFIFDAIGLGLFTVVGVEKSLAFGQPMWVAIIMGSLTGAAGGMLRDTLINEVPLVFRSELYAIACVLGGCIYWVCLRMGLAPVMTQIITAVSVIVIRVIAARYHIALPTLSGDHTDGADMEMHNTKEKE